MASDDDAAYALEGIYLFGGSLNVYEYVLDSGQFGQSTDTYHVAHFLLDDDAIIQARLMGKMRGPIEYFPVLYLLRRSTAPPPYPAWVQEKLFYKAWLFSLGRQFKGPGISVWGPGPTLGIACYKKDNRHIHTTP
jgi:hypothetical protein